jgi:hypothetical protein
LKPVKDNQAAFETAELAEGESESVLPG